MTPLATSDLARLRAQAERFEVVPLEREELTALLAAAETAGETTEALEVCLGSIRALNVGAAMTFEGIYKDLLARLRK